MYTPESHLINGFNGLRHRDTLNTMDLAVAMNCKFRPNGEMEKRRPIDYLGSIPTTITVAAVDYAYNSILGSGYYQTYSGDKYLVVAALYKLAAVYKTGIFYWKNGAVAFANLDLGTFGTTYEYDMQSFYNLLYMADGGKIIYWNGTTATRCSASTDPNMSYVEEFAGYLFGAGDPSNPQNIYISKLGDGTVWPVDTATDMYTLVAGGDEEKIVALKKWGKYLLVLKEHSVFIVSGNSTKNFSCAPMKLNLGCQAPWSVSVDDEGCYFMSDKKTICRLTGDIENISKNLDFSDIGLAGINDCFSITGRDCVFFWIGYDGVNGRDLYRFDKLKNDFTEYDSTWFTTFDFPVRCPGISTRGDIFFMDGVKCNVFNEESAIDPADEYFDNSNLYSIPMTMTTVKQFPGSPTQKKFNYLFVDCDCRPADTYVAYTVRGVSKNYVLGVGTAYQNVRRYIRINNPLGSDIRVSLINAGFGNCIVRTLGMIYTDCRINKNTEVAEG